MELTFNIPPHLIYSRHMNIVNDRETPRMYAYFEKDICFWINYT